MPEQLQTITLPNRGLVITTYIIVNHRPTNIGEWDIKSVEFCLDAEGTFCIGDYSMDELPRDTQEQIYEALEAYQMTKHGMRRLMSDLRIERITAEVRMPQL